MISNPPQGYPRISPYLDYEDVGAMRAWLSRAFGLVERHRQKTPNGKVLHAEMVLEEGVGMMGWPGPEFRNPRNLGQVTQSLYVYVDNLDAHYARSRNAGAETIEGPADQPYGDRRYGVADPEGHRWYFASRRAAC